MLGYEQPRSNNKKLVLGALTALALVGVVATVAMVSAPQPAQSYFEVETSAFQEFMEKHEKTYSSEAELKYRFSVFR